jgi:hypothetical protein
VRATFWLVVLYHLLHLLKFSGVILFGGGMVGSFVARTPADRKRAVHGVASPGLVITWLAGYLLTLQLGVPLGELWIIGGLLLSFMAQLALLRSVSREEASLGGALAALLPLVLVLVLMVFRPTWASLRP